MVNADGLTLFGAGSEWFWSMLQFLVVAITLAGIYVQLRQARAANAFAQTNAMAEQWNDERMVRRRLAVATILRDDGADADLSAHLSAIGNFWETVAGLVRQGHVNARSVYEMYGGTAGMWWSAVAGTTQALRGTRLDPTIFENFEWLAKRFSAANAKDGAPLEYDRDTLRGIFESAIPGMEDRVRGVEESRMVPVRRAPRPRRSSGSGG